jgi:hypothetical protein
MQGVLRGLWGYRGFILGSVKREFQSKYRNSLLGAAWTVLNPLSMIVVYTVIFAQVMHMRLPGVSNSFALQHPSLRRRADLESLCGDHRQGAKHVHRKRQPAEEAEFPACACQ